jgi:hypothetical protein
VVWLSVVKAIARKQELVSNVFFIGVVCNEMRERRRLDSGICLFRSQGSNDLRLLVCLPAPRRDFDPDTSRTSVRRRA